MLQSRRDMLHAVPREVLECSGGASLLSQRGCLARTVLLEVVAGSFAA